MDTFSVGPINPVAVGILHTALPVIQPPATLPGQTGRSAGPTAEPIQNLAQVLFRQTLQAASQYPISEPASGSASLAQDAATSLLAALNPTPATAGSASLAPAATSPAAGQTSISSSTTPAPNLQDLPTTQDAFGTSLSPDFAMQTALRFGAGVVTEAAASVPAAELGTGLLRDATAVLRLGNLQPRTGGPGPEAFAQPQTATQRVLRTYEGSSTGPSTQGASTVDLLA
jgi:hypothetical protein